MTSLCVLHIYHSARREPIFLLGNSVIIVAITVSPFDPPQPKEKTSVHNTIVFTLFNTQLFSRSFHHNSSTPLLPLCIRFCCPVSHSKQQSKTHRWNNRSTFQNQCIHSFFSSSRRIRSSSLASRILSRYARLKPSSECRFVRSFSHLHSHFLSPRPTKVVFRKIHFDLSTNYFRC